MPSDTKTRKLERSLGGHFDARTRRRGKEYFEAAAVQEILLLEDGVWGFVAGTRHYGMSLRWTLHARRTELLCFCSCPAFEQFGPCKHLWALVLEIDSGRYGPDEGFPEPIQVVNQVLGDMPPEWNAEFREWQSGRDGDAALDESDEDDDDDDDEEEDDNYQRSENEDEEVEVLDDPKPAKKEQRPAPAARDVSWDWSLTSLEASVPRRRTPWGQLGETDFELRYVIDAAASLLKSQVRLWVRVHKRLKNGSWGAGKEFTAKRTELSELRNTSDRAIFALLQGAVDPYMTFYSGDIGRDGYRLSTELFMRLLPELLASGRLFCADHRNAKTEAIALDGGASWEFRPALTRDEARDEVVLTGEFARPGESLAIDAPRAVFEAGFLIAAGRIARFHPREAMPVIGTLRTKPTIHAPLAAWPRFVQVLSRSTGITPALVQGLEPMEVGEPKVSLFVQARDGRTHQSTHLDCKIFFEYGAESVALLDSREWIVNEKGSAWQRDREHEQRALALFLELGGEVNVDPYHRDERLVIVSSKLPALAPALLHAGWKVSAEGKLWRQAGGSSFSVKSGIDWFDLEGGIEFGDGLVASLPALLAAAKAQANIVQLGDGSLGILPERWLESWGLLQLAGKPAGDALRFAKHQGWLLDALLAERENVSADKGFADLRKRLASFHGVQPKREPKGFGGELRAYQRDGVGWFEFLRSLGIGGCLADDMGLGKTVQVLALLESRRLARTRKGGVDLPSLVVAPRSLIFNWLEEARRFTPKLRVLDYTGVDRLERLAEVEEGGVDLILTTYGTLLRDVLELRERSFDYVVLDEAQAIKNATSQSAKAVRLLSAQHRLALSGTPIENHLGELWSLFEFLNPGMLGAARSFQAFTGRTGRAAADDPELARMSKALAPFFLRRTKQQVLPDLPEKTEQVLHCRLKGAERAEYDRLRDFYRDSLAQREQEVGLPKMKIHVLEALLRLRQAACHPGLIDKKRKRDSSAKLNTLLPMLEDICGEGHKALVFSQFTSLLSIVRQELDERGLTYEYLDGRTQKRKEKVERFQTDASCPLFLISIKAGGHGLNLTAADYVFLLDPWWNPAVESQAIDRVHRIGRTKPVIAYRLIASDTVEEKVVALQEHKRKLADAILGQGRVGLRDLTREDLELLLS